MASVKKVLEVLYRMKEGEPCKTKDWDTRVVPQTVRRILKKHELENKWDKKSFMNHDLALADRFFEAGLELAEVIGIHCTDLETVVHFSRNEILRNLKDSKEELFLGTGADRVVLRARRVEDKTKPLYCAPLAIQIDEEIYLPLTEGIVSSRSVDILQGPSIDTIYGNPVFTETPFETGAGIREAELRMEAVRRAGRPGIAQCGMASSISEYGYMCGFAVAHQPDNPMIGLALGPAELKSNYCVVNKVLTTAAFGAMIRSGSPAMIGGYSGPVEGALITNLATHILQRSLYDSEIASGSINDLRGMTSCSRPALWAISISGQALARNTRMIKDKVINQSAGPCTEDILYTNAAGLILATVSGFDISIGPRSAGGSWKNYMTPLEAWFCGDVMKAAADLTLEEAHNLVEYCMSKYEATIENQPKGKSFYECYDIKTITPTKEWADIDDRVREDLRRRGLNI